MISGTVDTTPSYDKLNALIFLKFAVGDGTTVLSVKKTITTATQRYMEQSTPNRELNLRALAFLGIDIGNNIQNAKIKPQK